jgi:hypothetical protein
LPVTQAKTYEILINQAMFHGHGNRLCAIGRIQFREDMADMVLDGG